jgi:hypothetical protein
LTGSLFPAVLPRGKISPLRGAMPVIDAERFEQGLPLAVWAREK